MNGVTGEQWHEPGWETDTLALPESRQGSRVRGAAVVAFASRLIARERAEMFRRARKGLPPTERGDPSIWDGR